ncbi:glycoside hydrolase family 9 protein [Sphingomonas sp. NIBR02145]|uniref:glycoside hydrolase family 9 protein n=1 Tax=Sphingomonas sp. NIBR02145 TaxID=3014784 RepID=UPI0022B38C9B|nr:glycoside hydrolase family 9 protein [Sphingomonas sp. NIBR02145]WHU04806.1 glycoside hydrolase family 9 protein [Sphingomonas sp. NIBR02145]
MQYRQATTHPSIPSLAGRGAALLLAAPLLLGASPPATPINLNQLGFQPGDPKIATLDDEGAALPWELQDASGRTVARGTASVFGKDPASGEIVQRIDFSSFRTPGSGYRLVAGNHASVPFDIRPNLYRPLARDALAFFYHQRAGVPIEARIVGAKWARPAGHPHEVAKCFTGKDEREMLWLGGCPYSLDVTGGWYDAGDHGKYVVNGGIALWTLLNAHERNPKALPAGPNGAPSLLDEARYEMDFLLRMQVPQGTRMALPSGPSKPLANSPGWRSVPADLADLDVSGMAHQKVADRWWTALPTPPQNDTQERLLYPPTTAATLNLAATAAQCARIWKTLDPAFAARCLAAAERAFAAARRNPQVYATNSFTGSGGYGDEQLSDEFYWAAAELFVTTGKAKYQQALAASPHFWNPAGEPGWPQVATLGTITLATRPSALAAPDVKRLRGRLTALADHFLGDEAGNGYRIPYLAKDYPWGSNGALLNRAMVLGVASDLTHDPKYRAGVIDAIDYILGRNPNHVSYVSGYGTASMQHPHHRFWAPSLDPTLPGPPPGVLSGGPNSTSMVDPVALQMKGKCAPQTCWSDDVRAYALNEVAINWNAPLVWVGAWLAE